MKKQKPDKGLIIVILLLLILGLFILSGASRIISLETKGNPYAYVIHQLIYGVAVGLIFFFICQKINYKFWKKFSLLLFFGSLMLMVLVFIPGLGYRHAGAQRWLNIGVSLQPSEFLKLGFIIYLSAFLSKKEKKQKINTLIPFLAMILLTASLVAVQ